MFNKEPKWQKHETVTEANTEFESALNPFDGAAATVALAKVIKATSSLRNASNGKIHPEDTTEYVLARVAGAREAAENAPDAAYAELFHAQELGLQSVANIQRESRHNQTAPTETAEMNMSDRKS